MLTTCSSTRDPACSFPRIRFQRQGHVWCCPVCRTLYILIRAYSQVAFSDGGSWRTWEPVPQ